VFLSPPSCLKILLVLDSTQRWDFPSPYTNLNSIWAWPNTLLDLKSSPLEKFSITQQQERGQRCPYHPILIRPKNCKPRKNCPKITNALRNPQNKIFSIVILSTKTKSGRPNDETIKIGWTTLPRRWRVLQTRRLQTRVDWRWLCPSHTLTVATHVGTWVQWMTEKILILAGIKETITMVGWCFGLINKSMRIGMYKIDVKQKQQEKTLGKLLRSKATRLQWK